MLTPNIIAYHDRFRCFPPIRPISRFGRCGMRRLSQVSYTIQELADSDQLTRIHLHARPNQDSVAYCDCAIHVQHRQEKRM